MPDAIGSSVRDIRPAPHAVLTADLIEKLQDIDATRINRDDAIVLRKAVIGLLSIVSTLEARITELENR